MSRSGSQYLGKARMEEARQTLVNLLEKIAEEQGYAVLAEDVRALSGGGANLTSALFKATLRARRRADLPLFAKVAAMSDHVRRQSPMRCHFTTELYYYTQVQTQFDAIQSRRDLPEEHRLRVPRLYGSRDQYLGETLVLDDLTAQGFRTFDRQQPADLEYVSAALDLLAKFHALSLAFHNQDPAGFELVAAALTMDVTKLRAMIPVVKPKMLASALTAAAGEHRGRLERFFREDQPCRFLQMTDMYRGKNRHVLVHGDLKPSNIMHRRREGKLELALVDFQLVRDGDPVEDLTYFLFTATDESFRRRHHRAMLDLYYERLRAALRLRADALYPDSVYRAQLEEYSMMGLMMAVVVLPMVLAEEDQLPDVGSDGYEATDFVVESSALYRERFNGVLNNYVEWGLL